MEFFRLLKSSYEAFQNKDYLCAIKCLVDALKLGLDTIHPDHKPTPMQNPSYNYTSAETCFDYLMQQCPDDCDKVEMQNSGALIVTLLPIIFDLIKLIWNRRQTS